MGSPNTRAPRRPRGRGAAMGHCPRRPGLVARLLKPCQYASDREVCRRAGCALPELACLAGECVVGDPLWRIPRSWCRKFPANTKRQAEYRDRGGPATASLFVGGDGDGSPGACCNTAPIPSATFHVVRPRSMQCPTPTTRLRRRNWCVRERRRARCPTWLAGPVIGCPRPRRPSDAQSRLPCRRWATPQPAPGRRPPVRCLRLRCLRLSAGTHAPFLAITRSG